MQQLSDAKPATKTYEFHPTDALTTHKVAQMCKVHSSSVARWTTEHGLAFYRTPGGHRRIVARDLAEFMRAWNMPTPFVLSGASGP